MAKKEYAPLSRAGYLSKVTGRDKEVLDELIQEIQHDHPNISREDVLKDLEWEGFDPALVEDKHRTSSPLTQTPSTKR